MCKDCGNNCDYSDCYKWSCNRNKDILDKATKNAQKIVKAFFEKIVSLQGQCQIIIGITVNTEEIKSAIENMDDKDYKYIHIRNRAFV